MQPLRDAHSGSKTASPTGSGVESGSTACCNPTLSSSGLLGGKMNWDVSTFLVQASSRFKGRKRDRELNSSRPGFRVRASIFPSLQEMMLFCREVWLQSSGSPWGSRLTTPALERRGHQSGECLAWGLMVFESWSESKCIWDMVGFFPVFRPLFLIHLLKKVYQCLHLLNIARVMRKQSLTQCLAHTRSSLHTCSLINEIYLKNAKKEDMKCQLRKLNA